MKTDPPKKIITCLRSVSISFAMLGLVLTAGFASTTVAVAATPDGQTPANEGICDGLKTNTTPGLYGLCVAYCEAQDLDITDKEPPKTKILANYRSRMQSGDPDMPCVQIPCPCWSTAQLASITSDGLASACLKSVTTSGSVIQLIDNTSYTHYALADTVRSRCAYLDFNPALPSPTVNFQSISPTDAQACLSAVADACASVGK